MKVVKFEKDAELLDKFLDLPARIRRGDPAWIPPFRQAIRAELAPDSAFLRHGERAQFLAFEGKEAIARCSALITYNDEASLGFIATSTPENPVERPTGLKLGFIGYFEAFDHEEASQAVLSAAVAWLRERGATVIRGPLNSSTYYPYRFMTEGFEHEPFFMEPYNPSHYPEHWERFGFKACNTYSSTLVDSAAFAASVAPHHARSLAAGYRSRPFDPKRFDTELKLMYDLSTAIFKDAWMWRPIDFAEFRALYAGMRGLLDADLCHFLFQGETPVGFVFGLPDYGPAVRAMKGSRSPIAKIRFLAKRRENPAAVLKTFGVLPEHRNGSLALALTYLMHEAAARKGYAKTLHALMRDDNTSLRMSHRFGGQTIKRYALYELEA